MLMARNARCILPGLPYHVTQRGSNRQRVFLSTAHRKIYLSLVARHQEDAGVRVLAYCFSLSLSLSVSLQSCALGFGAGSGRLARRVIPAGPWRLRPGRKRGTGAQRPFVAEPVLLLPAVGAPFMGRAALRGGQSGAGGTGGASRGLPMVQRGGPPGRGLRPGRRSGWRILGTLRRFSHVEGVA